MLKLSDWELIAAIPFAYIFALGSTWLLSYFCYKVPPFGILIGAQTSRLNKPTVSFLEKRLPPMTNLTNELASHLQANLDRAIVKDEVTDTWFTGQDLQHDIAILTTALRAANVGRDDVVFMSLDNSPVYVPLTTRSGRWAPPPTPSRRLRATRSWSTTLRRPNTLPCFSTGPGWGIQRCAWCRRDAHYRSADVPRPRADS